MGLIGWILYIILGIVLFYIMDFINNKYNITRREWVVFSIIFMLIFSGIFSHYKNNIFLIFVFMMFTDLFYSTYILDNDFFDEGSRNVYYYIVLIVIGYIINSSFINRVSKVLPSGEDLRIIIWFMVILFIYRFINKNSVAENNKNRMSDRSILYSYVRLKSKYGDNYTNKGINNIIYSIMIYRNNKRSVLYRRIDNIRFMINGRDCRHGIMQVEGSSFISDRDSISIVYNDILKIYSKYKGKRGKNIYYKIIEEYLPDECCDIKYIYDVIDKF